MDRLTQIEQRVAESRPVLRSDVRVLVETLREVEVLHRPHPDGGQGYDAAGKYVWFDQVCQTCGQYDEYAVAWPCPTAAAVQKLGEGS